MASVENPLKQYQGKVAMAAQSDQLQVLVFPKEGKALLKASLASWSQAKEWLTIHESWRNLCGSLAYIRLVDVAYRCFLLIRNVIVFPHICNLFLGLLDVLFYKNKRSSLAALSPDRILAPNFRHNSLHPRLTSYFQISMEAGEAGRPRWPVLRKPVGDFTDTTSVKVTHVFYKVYEIW